MGIMMGYRDMDAGYKPKILKLYSLPKNIVFVLEKTYLQGRTSFHQSGYRVECLISCQKMSNVNGLGTSGLGSCAGGQIYKMNAKWYLK